MPIRRDSNGDSRTNRFQGQEVLDLGVCLQILKKLIVCIPILIMIILYVIRSTAHPHEESEKLFNISKPNLVITDNRTDFESNSTGTKWARMRRHLYKL